MRPITASDISGSCLGVAAAFRGADARLRQDLLERCIESCRLAGSATATTEVSRWVNTTILWGIHVTVAAGSTASIQSIATSALCLPAHLHIVTALPSLIYSL